MLYEVITIMISALPYVTPLKPGSATLPLPGIDAAIFDEEGKEASPNEGGHLVIRKPWPGMLRGVFGNPERYKKAYFNRYADTYDPEDGARKDEDGYFWIMGRLDPRRKWRSASVRSIPSRRASRASRRTSRL